jgi:hypothetical protein
VIRSGSSRAARDRAAEVARARVRESAAPVTGGRSATSCSASSGCVRARPRVGECAGALKGSEAPHWATALSDRIELQRPFLVLLTAGADSNSPADLLLELGCTALRVASQRSGPSRILGSVTPGGRRPQGSSGSLTGCGGRPLARPYE